MDAIPQPKNPSQLYPQVAFIDPNLYYAPLFPKNIVPYNNQITPEEKDDKNPKK